MAGHHYTIVGGAGAVLLMSGVEVIASMPMSATTWFGAAVLTAIGFIGIAVAVLHDAKQHRPDRPVINATPHERENA